ncbi:MULTISPECIES: galactokinase [Shouchella]|uniref:Galactokinase n=1 Tax=Shouchella clausii TaxID=79880 RepID=A0A268RYH4_SHOCL|nr:MULTISPECIES: galactokinase [Shouchella]PAD43280.1 galactokinase [Bacillus sp. 7520-S]MBU8598429.1 galactokinase [Shouchella clausii]MCY1105449.1 galactokinase [Shouchella clausii]MEB5482184.1 galactokinase [Shouchella clausii]MED4160695.1 galactokinase [Shouchella clausii]
MNTNEIAAEFKTIFGSLPDRLFFAPGRVNLIGEHTDYNGGFVFPAALTMGTYLAVRRTNTNEFRLASKNFSQRIAFPNNELSYNKEDDWGNYPKGVIASFQHYGFDLGGADLYFFGNIPNGAGLSSSASIEMVTAYMVSSLTGANWDRLDLIKTCQHVENNFIGVNSGIMDQFAVGMGKADHALFLQTDSLQYELVPLTLGNHDIVITNSNKRRGLADSKYNERRAECEQALADLQATGLDIRTLSDVTLAVLEKHRTAFSTATVAKRASHVVSENKRVLEAVSALKAGNLHAFGQLMNESHQSLAHDYEVTGKELDALYQLQHRAPGCIGTRMTGAGFGGCTVSLVQTDKIEAFQAHVKKGYESEFGFQPSFYISRAGDGVIELPLAAAAD